MAFSMFLRWFDEIPIRPALRYGLGMTVALILFTGCADSVNSNSRTNRKSNILNLQATAGDNQSAPAGTTLPTRFALQAMVSNAPLTTGNVKWSTSAGTLDLVASTIDKNGNTKGPLLTLPDAPGVTNVTATVITDTATEAFIFHAVGQAGAAAKLAFTQQPVDSIQQKNVPSIIVAVEDAAGNIVADATNKITLALSNNPNSGMLLGPVTLSAQAGVATFSSVYIDKIGKGYTLSATSPNLTAAVSQPFNITDAGFTISACPKSPTSGTVSTSVAISACVSNTSGAQNSNLQIDWSLSSPGGQLLHPHSLTDTDGMASVLLTLSDSAQDNTILASVDGASSSVSTTLTVAGTAGTAGKLAFSALASDITQYAPFSLQVLAEDANGNVDSTFNGKIALSLSENPVSATLSGTTTVTAVNGVASFKNLAIDKAGGGLQLAAAAVGLTPASTSPFTVTSAGAQMTLVAQNLSAGLIASQHSNSFSVSVKDTSGNPLSQVPVSWVVTSGAGSIAAPYQSFTDATGIANSPTLTLSSLVELNTIKATIPSSPSVAAIVFYVKSFPQISFGACPTGVTANNAFNANLSFNAASSAALSVQLSAIGSATPTPIVLQTAQSSNATVTFSNVNIANAGSYTLRASILQTDGSDPGVSVTTCALTVN